MNSLRNLCAALAIACAVASVPATADTEYRHTTRRGDTLIGLANEMLLNPHNWPKLQKLNGIADPYHILPGTVLRIPVALMRREPASVRVTATSGDVRADGKQLAVGNTLERGAEVATGAQGFATIELIDGSRLVLQPDSRMKIEESSRYRNTNFPDTRLRLDAGRIESIVTKTSAPRPQYRIDTPTSTIGVRGTRFRVGADDTSGASRTEVTDGTVGVRGAGVKGTIGEAAPVAAGFGVLAEADGKVSPPVALLPPPELGDLPTLQERTIVRFVFPPLAGAQSYRVQVGADAEMRKVLAEAVSAKPEAKFADLPDGTYTLRVRAIDMKGLEGRDADRAFTLKARPEPPFAVAPLSGTKLVAESVELEWTTNPDAARYRVQIARDEQFTRVVADIDGVEGTTIMPARKLAPGDYFWRARSVRGSGDLGPWGDAQHFVLKPLPANPEPPKIDDSHATFGWSSEAGQTFLFQLARDEQFTDIVAEQHLDAPTTILARPLPDTYYMRVRATDPDGFVGPFTRPQKFDVPYPPPPWWLPLFLLAPLGL
jgi:hypothetical protein